MDTTQKRVDEGGGRETLEAEEAGGKMAEGKKDEVLNGILLRIKRSGRGDVVDDGKGTPIYPEDVLDVENLDVPLENQGIE